MKRIIIFLLAIALLGAGVVIYLQSKGHDIESILNTPDKYDLRVTCDGMENLFVSSSVNVTVKNTSDRTHDNVTVKITGYDADGMITKQKETVFSRTLGPNENFTKPITLPVKTVTCDCIIIDSDPK